jgi:hypothetical protein
MNGALLRISGLLVLMGALGYSRAAVPATAEAASAPDAAAPAPDAAAAPASAATAAPAPAAAVPVPAAAASATTATAKEKLSPEAETMLLERERVALMHKIREASSSATQERQRAIQANPELAALQKRIGELERELATSRQALREKMKAAGLANQGAPRPALDGMERMRQIDARMRELMGKRLEPPAAAAPAVDAAPAGE